MTQGIVNVSIYMKFYEVTPRYVNLSPPDVLTSSDEQRNGVDSGYLSHVTSVIMRIDMTHEHDIAPTIP